MQSHIQELHKIKYVSRRVLIDLFHRLRFKAIPIPLLTTQTDDVGAALRFHGGSSAGGAKLGGKEKGAFFVQLRRRKFGELGKPRYDKTMVHHIADTNWHYKTKAWLYRSYLYPAFGLLRLHFLTSLCGDTCEQKRSRRQLQYTHYIDSQIKSMATTKPAPIIQKKHHK